MRFVFPFVVSGILLFTVVFLSGCLQNNIPIDEEMPLAFSKDTVLFDTVFTTKGSATRQLKVYNKATEDIKATIGFEEDQGFFRMNVDGVPGEEFSEITIPAQDSIYVFLEVTIDPDQPQSISPFVITQKLSFETDYAFQQVVLTAWGQNANYITGENNKGRFSLLTCDLQQWTWDDPKPYVIYGVLFIDSCDIILPEGSELFVHGGVINNEIGIYNDGLVIFGSSASLKAEGSVDLPVIIQGDRLEPAFDRVPGQWNGLRFSAGAQCALRNTYIKNAVNALVLDSASQATLDACQITNSAGVGLAARHASVYAENCLIANGSVHPLQLTFGGNYEFRYCTIVNYGNISEALIANNFTCYDPNCNDIAYNKLDLNVKNSIVAGSTADQLALVNAQDHEDNYQVDLSYNLVRIEDVLEDNPDFFENICSPCWNFDFSEPLFENRDNLNFRLDSLSQAANLGEYNPAVPLDALDVMRDQMAPDLGCFEREQP